MRCHSDALPPPLPYQQQIYMTRARITKDSPGNPRWQFRDAHKLSETPEYAIWCGIIKRCCNKNNKSYKYYGGRGITVCSRWRNSFKAFLEDVGPRPSKTHSIDRYPDNNGNYEPGNVRWATSQEQAENQRSNILVTFKGKTATVKQWANSILGDNHSRVDYLRLLWRVKHWPIEVALTAPTGYRYSTKPGPNAILVEHNGEMMSVDRKAKILGISRQTIQGRMRRGWPKERWFEVGHIGRNQFE